MKTRKGTNLALAVALLGAALAVAAGAAGGTQTTHARTVVKLRATSLGKLLVNARGRTLYLYTPDAPRKSRCYGACATAWPPLLSTGKAKAAKGVKAKLLGLTRRTDGTHQVTYKGHPLYLYAGDAKAGQVNGEDVGGVWYALNAAGGKVEPKAAAAGSDNMGMGTSYGG